MIEENSLVNISTDASIDEIKKISQPTIKKVLEMRKKLVNINNSLEKYIQIERGRVSSQSRWRDILTDSYTIRHDLIQDKKTKEEIGSLITQAYELTTQILVELDVIDKVTTVLTVINKKGSSYSYAQLSNIELTSQITMLDQKAASKGGGFALRIKRSGLKDQLERVKKQQIYEALQTHFQTFIEPFIKWEQSPTTSWKPNKGVMGEAFQRHLEQKHENNINYTNDLNDLGSYGERWQLYIQSSGSDPYFTGPDTNSAQVKNINASIISNLNTVVETIKAILTILDENGVLKMDFDKLKNLLKQSEATKTVNYQVLEGIIQTAPDEVQDIIQDLIQKNQGNLNISFKRSASAKMEKIKIHSYVEFKDWQLSLKVDSK